MLVIWRGWGILVIPIVALTGIPVIVILNLAAAGLKLPAWTGFLALALGLFAAAAANWFIGKRFNGAPGRELIDPKTNERVVLKSRHSLFFIQMEYWAIPLALLGVFAFISAILTAVVGH